MSQNAWSPQQYEKFKDQRSQPFLDLLHLVQPQPGSRVVDLGCGTGELTAKLHQYSQAQETLGLDSSAEMLKKSGEFKEPGLVFQQQDIEKWQDEKGFDIIFSNAALQHCSNHEQLFKNLQKNLRPQGQLAIQMPMNHDYPTHIIADQMSHEKPWVDLLKNQVYDRNKNMLTVEDYARLLFKLGFKDQQVFMRVYGHVLDSREGVVEWVQGAMLTYFKGRLSNEDYPRFVTEFSERLFKELPDERPFFYPFKRALLWARL